MNAKLYSFKQYIGDVNLRIVDRASGIIRGELTPSKGYSTIQKVVKRNQDADKVREELELNLQYENGYWTWTSGTLDIVEKNDKITVGMLALHAETMEFIQNPNCLFLNNYWDVITIEQKLSFEDEVMIETGQSKKYSFSELIKPAIFKHKLNDYNFSAIAKAGSNDDVLFYMRKQGAGYQEVVVVHLTWSRKEERKDKFPVTEFYQNFADFQQRRLWKEV